MKYYRINFNNKITDETVTIRYKVILEEPEEQKSIMQFGSATFQILSAPDNYFLMGQAALQIIRMINLGMDDSYCLTHVTFASSQNQDILKVPKRAAVESAIRETNLDPNAPLPAIDIVKQNLIG
ncbi:hypothetical protein LOSG293_020520 [Secundilactobacillus oryzae JCM 18671]|uniref:Uncharacterized protein n=2 Tax=Secundilactobacillus oryzae TaxID=1202668 RepID=A0A081BGE6_9LACO|nr:hypothetical protein [Secundilactobacillus oryzae]GAK47114.1 hypothetical protein LOSG293_020520 [Secundilactobacillus oryzae JCM 18671]